MQGILKTDWWLTQQPDTQGQHQDIQNAQDEQLVNPAIKGLRPSLGCTRHPGLTAVTRKYSS